MVVLFLSIIVTATAAVVQSLERPGREPYHTHIHSDWRRLGDRTTIGPTGPEIHIPV